MTRTPQLPLKTIWLIATLAAAAPALAQGSLTLPVGQNMRDRPGQSGDVVLEINSAGAYAVDGRPVTSALLANTLLMLLNRSRDHVVYVRADAGLPSSAIDSANAIAARGTACVASFVGMQERGTVSHVSGDAGQEAGDVRRAIDVQLPTPLATPTTIVRQQTAAIVLEVLPGPTYRINTQPVQPERLESRLREIYDPRPIKVLYVRADAASPFKDVFHAMDAARASGVVEIVAAPRDLVIRPTLPAIDLAVRVTQRDDSAAARIQGNVGRCRRGDVYFGEFDFATGAKPESDRIYFEFQVEHPVKPLPGNTGPRYPEMLRAGKVTGEVLAQFVVDTTGRPVMETFKVIKSTHDLFTSSVRMALLDMHFTPATIGGKPVKQLVQMPFQFNLTP